MIARRVAMPRNNTSKSANPNHPKRGSALKVEPIRNLEDIQKIKDYLHDRSRDLCLFTMGVNTGFRANELLALRVGDIPISRNFPRLELKEKKTGDYRAVHLNEAVIAQLDHWMSLHPNPVSTAPLFPSKTTGQTLTVPALINLIKRWCHEAGVYDKFGTHSMRKTWGYHQRVTYNEPLSKLVKAFGHGSEAQTLDYLCITADEIAQLYKNVV